MEQFRHKSVFEEHLVNALNLSKGDAAIDCTGGGGGHTAQILAQIGATGNTIVIDRDPQAVATLKTRFAEAITAGTVTVQKGAFSNLKQYVVSPDLQGRVQGICADLGFSSPQVDQADRGFSFNLDGPLDMRMDPSSEGTTARDIVNNSSQEELETIFRDYGEEPKARSMARAIIRERSKDPILTTKRLANLASRTLIYGTKSKTHPATRIFQALRIAVNDELGELERMLESAMALLKPKGRIAIISFHSLEDRIVKQRFKIWAGEVASSLPRELPFLASEIASHKKAIGRIIKPFPVHPDSTEIQANPRARSAKLRVIEKLEPQEGQT